MRWFILLFLSVFFLMHLYAYLRVVKPAFGKSKLLFLPFVGGFLFPFFWRFADRDASPTFSYIVTLLGLLWMGFLLYFVLSGLLIELYRFLVYLSKRFLGINPLPTPSPRYAFFIVLLLSTSLSAYSYYETKRLHVEHHILYTDKIPVGRLKVLHISDLHLGPVMGMDKVSAVLEVYRREKPDLVVSTGDLVDGNMRNRAYLAQALREMDPPYGKYAVLGNHEYYKGVKQAIEFTERAGFRLLRGDRLRLDPINLTILGIDDDDCRLFRSCVGPLSDVEFLKDMDREDFILYLKHKPKLEPGAMGLFDLMLSGHTHGGVYYPIGRFVLTRMFISDRGFHKLGSSYIYISKGIGTGGPPMRLFSPPDVAIIEIVNKDRL
ncbi:MAG: metallophosphoesterase [Acidobacteria bacterium]|jgi:predicted MPP superfamily phosphohydrolase|nr:MAG: metallophosphoesterase [Acidobacteriota bacterium]